MNLSKSLLRSLSQANPFSTNSSRSLALKASLRLPRVRRSRERKSVRISALPGCICRTISISGKHLLRKIRDFRRIKSNSARNDQRELEKERELTKRLLVGSRWTRCSLLRILYQKRADSSLMIRSPFRHEPTCCRTCISARVSTCELKSLNVFSLKFGIT